MFDDADIYSFPWDNDDACDWVIAIFLLLGIVVQLGTVQYISLYHLNGLCAFLVNLRVVYNYLHVVGVYNETMQIWGVDLYEFLVKFFV